ncbi:tumor necrosis factor ligand superfamily member 14-like [Nematolebias whitei]|uniref:tumor necrosis factor ligand superfamily member 14-like n=1 Tax=Nematolebias whitei TaxID=451745 RepID=UPI00189A88AA|nr:tumor necrosis factor ligand superfamily member 14-like [Nematolebias whitei]
MSEGGTGAPPQVFVVDSQASYMPSDKKSKWTQGGMKILLLLLVLCVLGLVVEGCLIYKVYQKADALSLRPLCHNSSTPSERQDGTILSQKGPKETNEIPTLGPNVHRKPFAHLQGFSDPKTWADDVVQWEKLADTEINRMKYENGRLTIEEEGIYYLYSKLEFNAAKKCDVISHSMMKKTDAYGHPFKLLKSKSNRCFHLKSPSENTSDVGEDLKNSFLGGIYHLQKGDQIYVTLSKKLNLNPGSYENFVGAFMVSQ